MSESDETPHVLKLPEVLDLPAASRLHEQVLALSEKNIAVDATEVSRVGAQCIQVLLSAAQSWRDSGHAFSVNQASEAFAKTLQLLGVTDESVVPMEII